MGFLKKLNQEIDFTDQIEALKENTRSGIENTKKQFSMFCEEQGSSLEEAIDEMKITQDKKDVFKALQLWVNWLTKKGISHSSIPIYFSHLRTFLYYHGIPITDQERKKEIKYPKITEDEKHGLTIEEIKQLLETAGRKKKILYLTLLSSALRIGEAVQLKKKDLELVEHNFMINVRGAITKTQKGRTTFMSKEATRLVIPLWKKLDDEDLVYGTNKDPAKARSAEEVRFNDYRKKCGFNTKYDYSNRFHISLHSFRAYFITKVSRHDPNLAKRLAGQKSYLEQYDRMSTKEKLELYKKAELDLFVYEQKPVPEEIQELTKKVQELEEAKENETRWLELSMAKQKDTDEFIQEIMQSLYDGTGVMVAENRMEQVTPDGERRKKKLIKALEKAIGKKYKIAPKPIAITKEMLDDAEKLGKGNW